MTTDELESQLLNLIDEIEDKIDELEQEISQLKSDIAETQQTANTLKSEI